MSAQKVNLFVRKHGFYLLEKTLDGSFQTCQPSYQRIERTSIVYILHWHITLHLIQIFRIIVLTLHKIVHSLHKKIALPEWDKIIEYNCVTIMEKFITV